MQLKVPSELSTFRRLFVRRTMACVKQRSKGNKGELEPQLQYGDHHNIFFYSSSRVFLRFNKDQIRNLIFVLV